MLFGTTFLWFMPSFLGVDHEPTDGVWPVIQILVVLTVLMFVAAGWAVYKLLPWWRAAAITGSVLGLVVSLLWWIAESSVSGVTNTATNLGVRLVGSPAVLAVLLVPGISRALNGALRASAASAGGR